MKANGTKGFRQKPQGGRKERLNELEAKIANMEMASRISQMMIQQLMGNLRNMQQDLGRALGLLNETQYKILAIQEVSGLDLTKMNEIANTKRLVDFNEASDKEDLDGQFTVGSVGATVQADSTIILTSTTKETDQGIFRSRLKLADCGVPELINAFMGAEVGAKTTVALNGVEHQIELLGIRTPPPQAAEPEQIQVNVPAPAPGSTAVQVVQ